MKPRTGSWLGSVVPSSCGDLPSAHHRDFFLLNGTRCLDRVWFSISMFCFILGFICISDKVKKGHLQRAFFNLLQVQSLNLLNPDLQDFFKSILPLFEFHFFS